MLNSNALEQLSQLKQEIRANKDFAQGLVRGSKGRFGFVVLDDEREAFLNPEQMQKVFPGDRVEVSITKNEKDQLEATLEKLISSDLGEFVGSYLDRGKAHFVVPDVHMLSRWIFLAPKNRAGAKGGDYIRCKITRHPFQDGKGQAKVIEIIGKPNDDFVERKYIVSKFQLPDQWTDTQQQQASALQQDATPNDDVAHLRQDLTHLPFVTIDAATTKDMDDAIYAESKENGWQLYVAIADPSAGIALDSPLGQEAIKRAQTVYLPGKSAPMIPHELANGSYSLVEGEQRPALVSTLKIGNDGGVEEFSLAIAWIKSAAKLTYEQVSEYVDADINTAPLDENVRNSLAALDAVSKARFAYREQNTLVMEDRPDYDYKVDELGKIVDIVKTNRNSAQRIVEEAMLVTNNSAGAYLNQHSIPGLYSSHAGFKPDRLGQVHKLLEEDLGEVPEGITELKGYVALIQKLQTTPELSGLLSVLKRQLRPSELSAEPAPHLGLGFETYATITSPIRRFNDLYNHIALKHHLQNSNISILVKEQLANVKEQLSIGRMACRQLEQWLVCQYMQQFVGQSFAGIVAMINSQGIGVRLSDNGVDTFVQLRDRKDKEQKIEFSPERLTLVVDGKQFNFDDEVTVTITGTDQERRQVLATLG